MWLDNGDGTFTAQECDTLWEKYGADWQEKSGFKGDPRNLKPGDIVGQKKMSPMVNYSKHDIERKDKILSQKNYAESATTSTSKNVVRNYGLGFKAAFILGLGFEFGYITDGENSGIYMVGSYGCGIQASIGEYTNIHDLLGSSKSATDFFAPSIGVGEITSGTSGSTTADIGLGLVGSYDLNNLNKNGLPNAFSTGSIGGGVWYNSTTVFTFRRKNK